VTKTHILKEPHEVWKRMKADPDIILSKHPIPAQKRSGSLRYSQERFQLITKGDMASYRCEEVHQDAVYHLLAHGMLAPLRDNPRRFIAIGETYKGELGTRKGKLAKDEH